MRIIVNFGVNGPKKEVHWYSDLLDFPKLFNFQGHKWEWFMYNNAGNYYELTYSEIPTYDPNYYVDMPNFEDMFLWNENDKCECGAVYTSFNWDHMRFCKKHKPWSQV